MTKTQKRLARCRKPWWMPFRGHQWKYDIYQYHPDETEQCPRCGLKRQRIGTLFPGTWIYDAAEKFDYPTESLK